MSHRILTTSQGKLQDQTKNEKKQSRKQCIEEALASLPKAFQGSPCSYARRESPDWSHSSSLWTANPAHSIPAYHSTFPINEGIELPLPTAIR